MTGAQTSNSLDTAVAADADAPLEILWEDDHLCAIHKPPQLLVHSRTGRHQGSESTLIQIAREQLNCELFTVHRLDRATSGILVIAKTRDVASDLCRQFRDSEVIKSYLALVRGFILHEMNIDRSLRRRTASGRMTEQRVEAFTRVIPRAQFEIPIPSGRYQTTRCSLVDLFPRTGRWHQLRRHMNHVSHPILGDVEHGDNTQNRFYRRQFGVSRLLLAATRISFVHPASGSRMEMSCRPSPEIRRLLEQLRKHQSDGDAVSIAQRGG